MGNYFLPEAVTAPYNGEGNVKHHVCYFDENTLLELCMAIQAHIDSLDQPGLPKVVLKDIQYQPLTFGGMRYTAQVWWYTYET